jgi:hypothetical protein
VTAKRAGSQRKYLALLYAAATLLGAGHAFAADPAAPAASAPEGPPAAEVDLSEYPPPSARGNLLLGGALMTVGWYGAAVGTSYLWSDAPAADKLRIPVAGPWMALAETGCPTSEPDCSIIIVILRATLTTLSGVGQVGGLAVMGEGLFVETRQRRAQAEPKAVNAELRPLVAGDRIGLGLVGSF